MKMTTLSISGTLIQPLFTLSVGPFNRRGFILPPVLVNPLKLYHVNRGPLRLRRRRLLQGTISFRDNETPSPVTPMRSFFPPWETNKSLSCRTSTLSQRSTCVEEPHGRDSRSRTGKDFFVQTAHHSCSTVGFSWLLYFRFRNVKIIC